LCLFHFLVLFQVEKTLLSDRQIERSRMSKGMDGYPAKGGQFVVTLSEIDRAEILASARRAGVSPEEWLTAAARLPEQLISSTQDLASAFGQLCELLPDLDQEATSSVAARSARQALAVLMEMSMAHERCWGQRARLKVPVQRERVRVPA
jgi:predicted short-subunit dehydrogenase-like oxidoreductase (DUF2520 family)